MGDTETIRCDSALPPTNKSETGEGGADIEGGRTEPDRGGAEKNGTPTGEGGAKNGVAEDRPATAPAKGGSVHLEMATQGELLYP